MSVPVVDHPGDGGVVPRVEVRVAARVRLAVAVRPGDAVAAVVDCTEPVVGLRVETLRVLLAPFGLAFADLAQFEGARLAG